MYDQRRFVENLPLLADWNIQHSSPLRSYLMCRGGPEGWLRMIQKYGNACGPDEEHPI